MGYASYRFLRRFLFSATFTVGFLIVADVCAAPGTAADFTITDKVAMSDIEPVGCNIGKIVGGTNMMTNQFMPGAGYEPAYTRLLRRVESAGTNWFSWNAFGGVSEYDLNDDTWGNGGICHFYRIVDASGEPLSYENGSNMGDITGADHVVKLGEATIPMPGGSLPGGGWMPSEDRVYIDRDDLGLRYGDYAIITIKTVNLTAKMSNDRLSEWFNPNVGYTFTPDGWKLQLAEHDHSSLPSEFVAEDPGETCLKVEMLTTDAGNLGSWLFHAYDYGEGQYYSQLHPGASYKVDVWLRQEGMSTGEVSFNMSGAYDSQSQSTPWTVTGEWRKYSYEFTGPPYPVGYKWHPHMALQASGSGTLYIDNFVVYRNDEEHEFKPFTPNSTTFREFMDWVSPTGKKPTIRFYNSSYKTHSPMERMCSDWTSGSVDFMKNIKPSVMISTKHCLEFAYRTGNSPENRIVPHLTLSEEYTEEEWKKLVEYLGVPYNPDSDTPESKPMAYMRFNQRGSGTPWTDEFREIVVEYGNETWHNGAGGFGWHGFARPNYVHYGGPEYGMFAHYMFEEQVAGMPEWTEHNLAEKIKFAVNGNYSTEGKTAYGELAIRECDGSAVKYVSHANYIGPKWETGETPMGSFDEAGMQKTMVCGSKPGMIENYIAKHAQSREEAAANGLYYDYIVYEGGPSGYTFQNTTKKAQAVSEFYGKSVGMATAALDIYLYCSYYGYKHQNFFSFGSGRNWCSHTLPEQGGFRPHASWLAVKMRNRYAVGDRMLEVTANSMPDYTEGDATYDLVGCFAMKNENAYSVILTNRKLEGSHNGADFGDGSSEATLHLPFDSPVQINLYKLAQGDGTPLHPMENNWDSLMTVNLWREAAGDAPFPIPEHEGDTLPVRIVEEEIPVDNFSKDFVIDESTGGVAGGLPQGASYLYVFHLVSPKLSVANPLRNEAAPFHFGDIVREQLDREEQDLSSRKEAPVVRESGSASGTSQTDRTDVAPAANGRPAYLVGPAGSKAPAATRTARPDPVRVRAPRSKEPVVRADAAAEPENVADYTVEMKPSLAVNGAVASEWKGPNTPENTLDRDIRTRWAPKGTAGNAALTFDLGRTRMVSSATLVWYGVRPAASPFTIEVSANGKEYTAVHEGALRGRGTNTQICDFGATSARFVRFVFSPQARGFSIHEAALHAPASAAAR